jgi:hypothetical protein
MVPSTKWDFRDTMPEIIEGWKKILDDEMLFNSVRNGIFIGGLHDEQQMFPGRGTSHFTFKLIA